MKHTNAVRSLMCLVLAAVLVLGMMPTAFAAEGGTYGIQVLDNANGTVTVDVTEAAEGEIVTVTAQAGEDYTLTQVGYCTLDAEGKRGKTVEVAADENGVYSFAMPASEVLVGAAFQEGLTMIGNKIGGSKETDYTLYMANGEAFVSEDDASVSAFLTIDKRFFDIQDVTMRLEVRQYSTGGYTVAGVAEYDYAALQELAANADAETETTYTFRNVDIPTSEVFNSGWAEYCVVQFSRDCWTDALGNASYRWAYTGDATVLAAGVSIPQPIVWLYNLEEDSHRGALIRSILADLEIPAGTVNNENLNQNIGYLVGWEGYESVADPYSPESFDVEYILMGNLTEVQLDDFINGMQEHNIRVNLKSIPTAWTAGKTFAELFDIMAEEDEVLKAAVALDQMIYAAEELAEEVYGSSEYWAEFQEVLAEAIVALSTDAEESELGAALYLNARDALLEVYLKVTGKQLLAGELELIVTELESGEYEVSARLNGELEAPTYSYSWKPTGSGEETIVLPGDQLYKVNLEITGIDGFYGTLSARLNVPADPAFTVQGGNGVVRVALRPIETALNTPQVLGYVVELYLNGELVESAEAAAAETLVFEGLEDAAYAVRVYAYNAVGRSNIVERTVESNCYAAGFSDVNLDAWYHAAIDHAVGNGLMQGMGGSVFAPDADLSRAMLAQILYNMEGDGAKAEGVFGDVAEGAWYADAVNWAADLGLVEGFAGSFRPDDDLTRQELAAVLYRYARMKGMVAGETAELTFADADQVADWAEEAVRWCVANGILEGVGNNALNPGGTATRAQIAQVLMNLLAA